MALKLNRLRIFRAALWAFVVVTGLGASWFFLRGPGSGPTSMPEGAAAIHADLGQGDYQLTTTEGKQFTQASLRGHPSLIFFGFTHCPDVCPTTIGDISGWKEDLGVLGEDLRVFFLTVDPERDTQDVLKAYVAWLPDAVGVTGSITETSKATQSFRIFARKVPLEGGEYSMDHSAYVMLFDDQGKYNQIFGYQEAPAQVVAKLRQFMENRT